RTLPRRRQDGRALPCMPRARGQDDHVYCQRRNRGTPSQMRPALRRGDGCPAGGGLMTGLFSRPAFQRRVDGRGRRVAKLQRSEKAKAPQVKNTAAHSRWAGKVSGYNVGCIKEGETPRV